MKSLFIVSFSLLFFAHALPAQNNALRVRSVAPEIALPRLDGKVLTLSSLKGSLVLVDFWATWCAPCVQEQPELKKMYRKYDKEVKAGKFEILGVSLDRKKENWEKGIARLKITWPQVSDLKYWSSPVADAYGVEGLPFNVLVDGDGKIAAINLHGSELSRFIENYLEKNSQ